MAHLIHSVLPEKPRKIIYIHPDDSVKKCIDLMVNHDIGALVIIDDDHQLVGIVSERDIVRGCLDAAKDLNTTKASEIAYKKISILSPHDVVEKAMQVITDSKRRHILIRENEEYVAILSIGDLLNHILDDKTRVIEHLENYIHN